MRVKSKLLIFGLVFGGIILLMSVGTFYKVKHRASVKENILTLDSIPYRSIDSSLKKIDPSDNFKIIFFFNSECEHCQGEARLVSANASSFINSDIYFFSTEELTPINKFAEKFGLAKKSNFKIGQVDYDKVIYKMGVNTYPMCFIYSQDGKLLKRYAGEVKIEAIVKYLR